MPKAFASSPNKQSPKRAPLNMKASPELRARIEEAARASGLSLSQEVERRLLTSFDTEQSFGPDHVQQLLRRVGWAVQQVERVRGERWDESPASFFRTVGAIKGALEDLQPSYPPDHDHPIIVTLRSKLKAVEVAHASREKLAAAVGGEEKESFVLLDRLVSNQELERLLVGKPREVASVATDHQKNLRAWWKARQAYDAEIERGLDAEEALADEGEQMMLELRRARSNKRKGINR